MQQLQDHEYALKQGNSKDGQLLNKKDYCKIAAEVSMGFENLSTRYDKILSITRPQQNN